MVVRELPKYSMAAVEIIFDTLDEWRRRADDLLQNEEDRDSPNSDRMASLGQRIIALNNAATALEDIVNEAAERRKK